MDRVLLSNATEAQLSSLAGIWMGQQEESKVIYASHLGQDVILLPFKGAENIYPGPQDLSESTLFHNATKT